MLHSLRARLLLTYLAIIAVVLGVVAAALAVLIIRNPAIYRRVYTRQALALQIARRRLESGPVEEPALAWREAVRIAEVLQARALVLSPDGQVWRDTAPTAPALHFPPLTGKDVQHGRVRAADGSPWAYSALRVRNGWWLVIAEPLPRPLEMLWRNRQDWLVPLAEAAVLALLLALVLAWWLSRWVARPLRRTAKAARALAEGHYQPVPEEGPQEARLLARTFNEMARRVEASQRSQREFVANVSHELKTPITSIQGFAQAIVDGTADDPESVRTAAQVITEEAGRMHRLVLALLDLARLDAGTADLRREAVALRPLLENLCLHFRPQAETAGVRLTLEAPDGLSVTGDSDRLAQVFTNLLDNALKHTPRGGEVRVQARRTADGVEVSVSDTGEGIPPEAQQRIFERFYRGDKARSGGSAGLGLAIAREIVRAHGGDITVQSTPGKGSTFVVKLRL